MPPRLRADRLLVERGLFESRAKAQAAIAAGLVTADTAPVRKPSDEIAVDAALRAEPAFAWVSRGGVKLVAALDHFGIDVAGRICLDVGASTGGFCDVLLARGARRVYAVDVGTGQLHPRLRGRAEIVSMERTDIRALDPAALAEPPDVITIDVSFISLKHVLPAAIALAARPADVVALIKPQFEVTRAEIKKGIVRDPEVHRRVCDEFAGFAASLGLTGIVQCCSPIDGADGNREFFIGARLG
jgi:23S rRNA (cytidine1920-2'-O)/16S rRNA (cytidine1409-2'-O)-methyltransferase